MTGAAQILPDGTGSRTIEAADCSLEDGLLSLWMADMDFEVAPEITEALICGVWHGICG
ncbi:MAG: hypothetical protein K5841_00990 [Fretibacterium sp.]|nr:hypothetical protein [Fretibacterium sp.]